MTQRKDDELDQEKEETIKQSPESDLEKRVGIRAFPDHLFQDNEY